MRPDSCGAISTVMHESKCVEEGWGGVMAEGEALVDVPAVLPVYSSRLCGQVLGRRRF